MIDEIIKGIFFFLIVSVIKIAWAVYYKFFMHINNAFDDDKLLVPLLLIEKVEFGLENLVQFYTAPIILIFLYLLWVFNCNDFC